MVNDGIVVVIFAWVGGRCRCRCKYNLIYKLYINYILINEHENWVGTVIVKSFKFIKFIPPMLLFPHIQSTQLQLLTVLTVITITCVLSSIIYMILYAII